MAWLQKDPSGNFHISFRFGGKKFKRSLRTQNQKQATSRKLRLEETIQLINSGRVELPTNCCLANSTWWELPSSIRF